MTAMHPLANHVTSDPNPDLAQAATVGNNDNEDDDRIVIKRPCAVDNDAFMCSHHVPTTDAVHPGRSVPTHTLPSPREVCCHIN
jgi:hypothetical protein